MDARQAHDVGRDGAREVLAAVADALRPFGADDADRSAATHASGVVLAVSGGRDSMVLLHAASAAGRDAVRAVATFDHGTGAHAREAVARVEAAAHALDFPVVVGAAMRAGRNEAEWRDARWRFLRTAAADAGAAALVTAHTRDDHLETVVMRTLRAAGARGLAALAAPSTWGSVVIVRPLLALSREVVAHYAAAHALDWVNDPSNADRRHLRVRVRGDLLRAIGRVHADGAARLLGVAAEAARWRADAEVWSARVAPRRPTARVAVITLDGCGAGALAVFWPAFAARAGVRLDRRAVARLIAYTPRVVARVHAGTVQPARVPVAGGVVDVTCAEQYAGAPRVWSFTVERAPTTALFDAASTAAVGVARLDASDYAYPFCADRSHPCAVSDSPSAVPPRRAALVAPAVDPARDPRLAGRKLRRVVYSEQEIAARVAALGREITAAYPDGELLVLGLLKGSFIFLSDLVRQVVRPLQVDFLVASSYGAATVSSGNVRLVYDPETSLEGKHILLVEDIVDSGRTLQTLMGLLGQRRPRSLEICALLHKGIASHLEHPVRFTGFDAPDEFLVGYGLDHAEQFRHVPYVASLAS